MIQRAGFIKTGRKPAHDHVPSHLEWRQSCVEFLPSTKSSRPFLDQADRFARKELYPLSERMDREEWWPDKAFRVIGDNGFFGATIPKNTAAPVWTFWRPAWCCRASHAGTMRWR